MIHLRYLGKITRHPNPVSTMNLRLREARKNRKWQDHNANYNRKPLPTARWLSSINWQFFCQVPTSYVNHALICYSGAFPHVLEILPHCCQHMPHLCSIKDKSSRSSLAGINGKLNGFWFLEEERGLKGWDGTSEAWTKLFYMAFDNGICRWWWSSYC